MQTLNLDQLGAASLAGGILGITLQARGAAFAVQVHTRTGEAVMVKARSKEPRLFADPRKAMLLLRQLGLTQWTVDASSWQPEAKALERSPRPDRSAALKATHEAADYDRWFRAKVQAAQDDPRPGIGAEEWAQMRAQKLAALRQGLASKTAS